MARKPVAHRIVSNSRRAAVDEVHDLARRSARCAGADVDPAVLDPVQEQVVDHRAAAR